MNKCIVCGNLAIDPVLSKLEYVNKETGEILNTKVCNFTIACDDGFGEYKNTQFFRVAVWRKLGEACAKYLKKGHQVLVSGPVFLNNYVDKSNNLRSVMEIRADEIQFLNNKKPGVVTPEENKEAEEPEAVEENPKTEVVLDDMPY